MDRIETKAVLVVLDAQNDFMGEDNPNLAGFVRAVENINRAVALFRANKLPIIWVQHTSKRKPAGSSAWEIAGALRAEPQDPRVIKQRQNAFWETDLDGRLCALDARTVVICGFFSEYCVLSTARGAAERGYTCHVLKEAIASFDDRRTEFVCEIEQAVSIDDLPNLIPLSDSKEHDRPNAG